MRSNINIKFVYTGTDSGVESGRNLTLNKIYNVVELVITPDPDVLKATIVDDLGLLVQTREAINTNNSIWSITRVRIEGPNGNDVILIGS